MIIFKDKNFYIQQQGEQAKIGSITFEVLTAFLRLFSAEKIESLKEFKKGCLHWQMFIHVMADRIISKRCEKRVKRKISR